MDRTRQAGFSLVELMVAMLVTLIVSGAVYGLVAGGKSAFRREPELSDRQQNARIAMAAIQQDIGNTGLNMPAFVQVFMPGLDGVGLAGSDALEMVVGRAQCPMAIRCPNSAAAATMDTPILTPACLSEPPQLGAAVFPGAAAVGALTITPQAACAGAAADGASILVNNTSGPAEWRPAGGFPGAGAVPDAVMSVEVVRYEIAADADGVPCLYRSSSGGRNLADNYATFNPPPGADWQMVARGIDTLEVQYVDGTLVAADTPRVIDPVDFGTIVRQVNVTVASRVTAPGIAGFTTAQGANVLSGQLVSQISPRAALVNLQGQGWR
jgi:prepilin-type N-terminal cleavage/methylation domain-containing protein